jgi:hypothetical protein
MGQDRAGFYTYEWFENGLLRLNIHNVDRIVPEWQNITVGDRMWFYPYPIGSTPTMRPSSMSTVPPPAAEIFTVEGMSCTNREHTA